LTEKDLFINKIAEQAEQAQGATSPELEVVAASPNLQGNPASRLQAKETWIRWLSLA